LFVSKPARTTKNNILGNLPQVVLHPGASQLEGASFTARHLAFISQDSQLVPGGAPQAPQLVVRDTSQNRSFLVSKSTTGSFSDGEAVQASLSDTGRTATVVSLATNMTADPDQPATIDVFVAPVNVPADK